MYQGPWCACYRLTCLRSCLVRVSSARSSARFSAAGVPQGCLLRPDLYNFYTYAIRRRYGSVHLRPERAFCLPPPSEGDGRSDGVGQITQRERLKINGTKCVAVRFTRTPPPPTTLSEWVRQFSPLKLTREVPRRAFRPTPNMAIAHRCHPRKLFRGQKYTDAPPGETQSSWFAQQAAYLHFDIATSFSSTL